MTVASRICDVAYWIALTGWFAALAAAGIAAMSVFGTLPAMDVALGDFPSHPPQEHGRLAAGAVMQNVFFSVDVIQFAVAPVVVITLLAQVLVLGDSLRRWSNVGRALCIVAAASLFAYHVAAIAPVMNRHWRAFWDAAKAGDTERAAGERAAFNRLHPRADAVLRVNVVLLSVSIGLSAVALRPPLPRRPPSALETPRLAQRRS